MFKNVSVVGLSDGRNNPSFITPWSFIHMFFGFTYYVVLSKSMTYKNNFITMNIFHALYELKDIFCAYVLKINGIWYNNTIINSIGDTICAIIGWCIAYVIFGKSNINNLTKAFVIFTNITTVILFNLYEVEEA